MAESREYDPEIKDIASYVQNYKVDSDLAVSIPRCSSQSSLPADPLYCSYPASQPDRRR